MHCLKSSNTLVKNLLNMKVKTMKFKKIMSVLATLLILSSSVACSSTADAEDNFLPESQNDYIFTTLPSNGNLRVNYIDVGQGDSEFIEFPNGETMLISKRLYIYNASLQWQSACKLYRCRSGRQRIYRISKR